MDTPSIAHDGPGSGAPRSLISPEAIRTVLSELSAQTSRKRLSAEMAHIEAIRQLVNMGAMETLEVFLPCALRLLGKPYTLAEHFPFSPLYRATMPSQLLFKTGRQVAKSTNLAAHGVMLANAVPYFRTLYITPLYEQIRRFSTNYVRPFVDSSPLRSMWCGTNTEQSVLQRSFKNQSKMLFSFALLDTERIRGISADRFSIDEVQDMDPDHLPIIGEVVSASKWRLRQYAGTPKSVDNPIEGLWKRSSQAEWFIPCYRCNAWNIPSLDYHIDAMIGPMRDDIGPDRPGLVCHKCQKPIDPRPPHGRWVHRHPDRRWKFAGYHIPQIILPMHCFYPKMWAELLAKQAGYGGMPVHAFYNEVLGESVDAGQKLLSQTELEAAAILPWSNNPRDPDPAIAQLLPYYERTVMGIDWGGGGEDGVSYTSLALMGYTSEGKIHVLWGKRLTTPNDHMREAREVIHWVNRFNVDFVAHDYTGAGTVRETVLIQAGYDAARIMPFQYVRAAIHNLITHTPATPLHPRDHWKLDKTRSLLYTFQAIKLRLVQFFRPDYIDDDNPGLLHDFLALVEEKTSSRYAGDLYSITRTLTLSDDFAQAVNIGCAALWHIGQAWPNFAEAAAIGRVTREMQEAAGNSTMGWETDRLRDFLQGP